MGSPKRWRNRQCCINASPAKGVHSLTLCNKSSVSRVAENPLRALTQEPLKLSVAQGAHPWNQAFDTYNVGPSNA